MCLTEDRTYLLFRFIQGVFSSLYTDICHEFSHMTVIIYQSVVMEKGL